MAYDILFLAGRIIVGLFYVTSGINHFRNLKMMVAYAKSKKVPLPGLAVPTTGLMLLAGGASVLLGLYPAVGSAIIVLFLLPVSLMMHNFWALPPEEKALQKVNFMKNMALLGSALMFLAISTPWPLSIG